MQKNVRSLMLCCLVAVVAAATPASAQEAAPTNRIVDVAVAEQPEETVIRIVGEENPTFSVYRLRNPLRLFVDISNATLDGVPSSIDVDNGVITQIAAVEYDDDVAQVARIVIGFERDALYDVVADGSDVVVTVDAEGRRAFIAGDPETTAEMEQLRTELTEASDRLDALEQAATAAEEQRQDAEAALLRAQAEAQRAEVERLAAIEARSRVEEQLDEASTERDRAVADAERIQEELAEREEQLEALSDQREEALQTIETMQSEVSEAREVIEQRDVELERLRREQAELEARINAIRAEEAEASQDDLDALIAERDVQIAELNERQAELQELLDAQRINEERLAEALRDARTYQQQQEDAAQRAEEAERELAAAREQAERLRSERDAANRRAEDAMRAAQEAEDARQAERARAAQEAEEARQAERARAAREAEDARRAEQRQEQATPSEPPPPPARPAIVDVRFESADGLDRVVIETQGVVQYSSLPWSGSRAAIVIDEAQLPDRLRRTLDTRAVGQAINYVSTYTDESGRVHITAETRGAGTELLRQEGDRLIWEFTPATQDTRAPVAANGSQTLAAPVAGTYTSQASGYDLTTIPGSGGSADRPQMTRKRITIDLRSADIQNVLRLIADEGNINIVASDDVGGAITLRLRSVPLDEALMTILRSQGLGWEQQGNIIRVAPQSVFFEEHQRRLELIESAQEIAALRVRLIPINYAEAEQISSLVAGLLSQRGSVSYDERTNTMIVTDVEENLDAAETLVEQLDSQTPQILIEARVVETNDQFRRQLGIQWGGDAVFDQAIGNSTGLIFPSTIGLGGGATDGQAPIAGTSTNPNFAVNLPAPAGTGEGGAIGFTFGSLNRAFNLNLRLSAAESEGTAKVISAPRIMTMDNEAATISSGVSIPVSVVSAAGAQTVFFDAALTLDVEPRVTPDGSIFLAIDITKNEPDFENTGARGDPSIIRREASTQLLVRDGDTTVIGGIFQRNTGYSNSKVPFFSEIPILGALFRNSSQTDVRNELLVFITPRIVNRELSIGSVGSGDDIVPPQENND